MMLRPAHALLIVLLALAAPARAASPAAAEPCRAVEAQGETFTVCTIDLRKQRLRLFWLQDDGKPYGALGTLAEKQGGRLAFAMNAGMYDKDQAPVGLYVEDGREEKRISRASGPGNFHLKPNGVFYVAGGQAGVMETDAYLRRRIKPSLATQSGPMLVIDGRIHPRFSGEGPSRKYRNGVGITDPRTVLFAISDEPVSFGAFARLFRDALSCRNALFLDGSVSVLHAADLNRTDVSLKPIGPIVAAVRR